MVGGGDPGMQEPNKNMINQKKSEEIMSIDKTRMKLWDTYFEFS